MNSGRWDHSVFPQALAKMKLCVKCLGMYNKVKHAWGDTSHYGFEVMEWILLKTKKNTIVIKYGRIHDVDMI